MEKKQNILRIKKVNLVNCFKYFSTIFSAKEKNIERVEKCLNVKQEMYYYIGDLISLTNINAEKLINANPTSVLMWKIVAHLYMSGTIRDLGALLTYFWMQIIQKFELLSQCNDGSR